MAFLLDTNVVSELRKYSPDHNVATWHEREGRSQAYISTLVVGEIWRGIERIRTRDPKQATALEQWLAGLISSYEDRILPVTHEIAQEWGRLSGSPNPPPVVDGLMAATARVHRLILVTRNVADVAPTGVMTVNPFSA